MFSAFPVPACAHKAALNLHGLHHATVTTSVSWQRQHVHTFYCKAFHTQAGTVLQGTSSVIPRHNGLYAWAPSALLKEREKLACSEPRKWEVHKGKSLDCFGNCPDNHPTGVLRASLTYFLGSLSQHCPQLCWHKTLKDPEKKWGKEFGAWGGNPNMLGHQQVKVSCITACEKLPFTCLCAARPKNLPSWGPQPSREPAAWQTRCHSGWSASLPMNEPNQVWVKHCKVSCEHCPANPGNTLAL